MILKLYRKTKLCFRCKKLLGVVFVTQIKDNNPLDISLCLSCAKIIGIKPVEDMLTRLDINYDQIVELDKELGNILCGWASMEKEIHDLETYGELDSKKLREWQAEQFGKLAQKQETSNVEKCEKCNKHSAGVFVTKVKNGENKNTRLCSECAITIGILGGGAIKRSGQYTHDVDSVLDEISLNLKNTL